MKKKIALIYGVTGQDGAYLAKLLLKVPVHDYTNGFRFYSRSAAQTIIKKCNKSGGGFIILSEIILVLWKKNFKISETTTIFRNRMRGESSVNIKLIIDSLIGLFKLYLLKKSSNISSLLFRKYQVHANSLFRSCRYNISRNIKKY